MLEHELGDGVWQLCSLGSFGLQVIWLKLVEKITTFIISWTKKLGGKTVLRSFTKLLRTQFFPFLLIHLQWISFAPSWFPSYLQNGCCSSRHHITHNEESLSCCLFPRNKELFPRNSLADFPSNLVCQNATDWLKLKKCHLLGGSISSIHPSPSPSSLCPVRLMCMGRINRQPCSLTSGWTQPRRGHQKVLPEQEEGAVRVLIPLCPSCWIVMSYLHLLSKASAPIRQPSPYHITFLVWVPAPNLGASSDRGGNSSPPLLAPGCFTTPPAMPKPFAHLCKSSFIYPLLNCPVWMYYSLPFPRPDWYTGLGIKLPLQSWITVSWASSQKVSLALNPLSVSNTMHLLPTPPCWLPHLCQQHHHPFSLPGSKLGYQFLFPTALSSTQSRTGSMDSTFTLPFLTPYPIAGPSHCSLPHDGSLFNDPPASDSCHSLLPQETSLTTALIMILFSCSKTCS